MSSPCGRWRRSSRIRATILSTRRESIEHRVLVNETEAIHLDEPVCVDHVIRGEGYDARIPVGRFLRGPRRLTDEKVRQLRSAAGAEIAQKWLTASKPANGAGAVADETSPQERQTR